MFLQPLPPPRVIMFLGDPHGLLVLPEIPENIWIIITNIYNNNSIYYTHIKYVLYARSSAERFACIRIPFNPTNNPERWVCSHFLDEETKKPRVEPSVSPS